ncbi:hypothetical protein COS77_02325 [Candidatus Roizmanbacteria bacterium CG06_land_8_20_14_3_00_34_14]|uniref:Peptidase M56 domain-containing protein n=2 Tax=Candidatus Roizmaniibacteriota TaxID=1752723 RepID=A0A2M7AUI3_9BACT|nr:MAG: hypothetical protein COT02_02505 [Candidatus Roizmanbacteria bacterium CG07_land_8_20_14_0_80_34_15]PIU74291.1 MAG: hypothetical protein COS77_02325 [Candidatus Roizmanbacteria bacterium CG06_land_8_20_14_3_00_34_14]
MKLTTNIKPKIGLWKFLPKIISTKTAQCIYPFIFLPEDIYKDLISLTPKPESVAVLLHEKVHLERQKRKGIILWIILYIISPKFRLNEELLAFKEQIKYLKKLNLTLDLELRAKRLSSWLYLWCISYKKALLELKKL